MAAHNIIIRVTAVVLGALCNAMERKMREIIADIQERIKWQAESLEGSRIMIAQYQAAVQRELYHIEQRSQRYSAVRPKVEEVKHE